MNLVLCIVFVLFFEEKKYAFMAVMAVIRCSVIQLFMLFYFILEISKMNM